jgi:hypothetical protein
LIPGTAPISSIGTIVLVDTTIIVPAAAAARAVASSPSGCAIRCDAIGATMSGRAIGWPSTVVASETCETSTSIRGTSHQRAQAARLPRNVSSSRAPDA